VPSASAPVTALLFTAPIATNVDWSSPDGPQLAALVT
jgi:hypothetical protein